MMGGPNGSGHYVGAVLVVGGGISGMQSALDLADSGFKVYLLETSPGIGGWMSKLDKTFPTNDCSMCIMAPKLVGTGRHHNIDVIHSPKLSLSRFCSNRIYSQHPNGSHKLPRRQVGEHSCIGYSPNSCTAARNAAMWLSGQGMP